MVSFETGSHYHVKIMTQQMLIQSGDLGRGMLAITINLHRHVITKLVGIAVARLHRAANAQVKRQADHRCRRWDMLMRAVHRTVIDHHDIHLRQMLVQPVDDLGNGA